MKAEETWAEQATYMYDFHIPLIGSKTAIK